MSKKRYIDTKFWDDNYIIDLDPIEKLLFIYSLTNPLTNIAGIYEIQLKRIAFDTGIDKDMVTKIFDRFSNDNRIKYYEGYLIIINFLKHQKLNPKIAKGIEMIISELPNDIKKYVYSIHSLSKALNYININYNININNNIEFSPNVIETTAYLYNSIPQDLRPSKWDKTPPDLKTWYIHIDRLNRIDNANFEYIRKVIDFSMHSNFWESVIQSAEGFRRNFPKIEMQMKKNKKKVEKWFYSYTDEEGNRIEKSSLGNKRIMK